jgi:hypothetical protein
LKPFFDELKIPKGLNGNEQVGKPFFDVFRPDQPCENENLIISMEVFRRMQDLYEAFVDGRYFLCLAQYDYMPQIYKDPIPEWAKAWTKIKFLESAIWSYCSGFDFFLQINWFYFRIFKYVKKCPHILTTENFDKIIHDCNITSLCETKVGSVSVLNDEILKNLNSFKSSLVFNEIRNLCNSIKHRQKIEFNDLASLKHPFLINICGYDSNSTILKRDFSSVIDSLKSFHKELYNLCDKSIPLWNFGENQSKI